MDFNTTASPKPTVTDLVPVSQASVAGTELTESHNAELQRLLYYSQLEAVHLKLEVKRLNLENNRLKLRIA
jgi:hypothetical protein